MTKDLFMTKLAAVFSTGKVDGIYMLHEDYDYSQPVKEITFTFHGSHIEPEAMADLCELCMSTTIGVMIETEYNSPFRCDTYTLEITVTPTKDLIDRES